jgi:hypothetical protein
MTRVGSQRHRKKVVVVAVVVVLLIDVVPYLFDVKCEVMLNSSYILCVCVCAFVRY